MLNMYVHRKDVTTTDLMILRGSDCAKAYPLRGRPEEQDIPPRYIVVYTLYVDGLSAIQGHLPW